MVMMPERIPELPTHFDENIIALLHDVGDRDILPYFRNLQALDIETKSSATDFVTIADKQAEKQLIRGLQPLLPDARFIAEENTAQFGLPEALDSGFVWTIDPLDGTRNFVKGNTEFCSMLGLLYNGVPVAAWLHKPLSKESVLARIGQPPQFINSDGQIQICAGRTDNAPLDKMRGNMNAMGFTADIRDRVREKLKTLKGRFHVGSAGVEAMNIACGRSDYLMHSKLTYWDSVPVVTVMEALGYHVRLGPSGTPYKAGDKGVLLAAPTQAVWQQLADFVWSA